MAEHIRICHECHHSDVYTDSVAPECLCKKCGSQDTRRENRVLYTVLPYGDDVKLAVADILLPMLEFPPNVHLIRCRRQGEYGTKAFIQGEGAIHIKRFSLPLPKLVVVEVGALGVSAKAERLTEASDG